MSISDPTIGEISMFAGNFAPKGWAFCDGQLLSIAQNTALFSILGTTYGGNGQTTFALPDLRGRVPLHVGASTGPGLSSYSLGQSSGAERITLSVAHIPSHTHLVNAHKATGGAADPTNALLAKYGTTIPPDGPYVSGQSPDTTLDNRTIGNTGGSQPFDIRQPSLGINFIIALQGIFPSRS